MLSRALARRYRGFLFWLGQQQFFGWLGPRFFAPVDTWLYRRTRGALLSAGPAVLPLLMLTTQGRTSGRLRCVPLLYFQRRDEIIVVASNWGQPKHPAWSDNLLANPQAAVQIRNTVCSVTARLLDAEEKAHVWPELSSFCPVWRSYQDRSGRDLRVFALCSAERLSRRV